jgi:hypothetical protein
MSRNTNPKPEGLDRPVVHIHRVCNALWGDCGTSHAPSLGSTGWAGRLSRRGEVPLTADPFMPGVASETLQGIEAGAAAWPGARAFHGQAEH